MEAQDAMIRECDCRPGRSLSTARCDLRSLRPGGVVGGVAVIVRVPGGGIVLSDFKAGRPYPCPFALLLSPA